MQRLNAYVDEVRRGARVQPSSVDFWVIEDGRLTKITAELPYYGSLGPLFYAFGLISTEELQAGAGAYSDGLHTVFASHTACHLLCMCILPSAHWSELPQVHHYTCMQGHARPQVYVLMRAGQDTTNFLEWLSALVEEALRASQQHDTLKRVVRELRASLEDRFALAAIQVGGTLPRMLACMHPAPALHVHACSRKFAIAPMLLCTWTQGCMRAGTGRQNCVLKRRMHARQVGGEFAVSTAEQRRQIQALRTLGSCLAALAADDPPPVRGCAPHLCLTLWLLVMSQSSRVGSDPHGTVACR